MPKVIVLIKCSVGFGTKIACSHFLILLSTSLKQEMTPYAGKLLSVLIHGLSDRNAAVRRNNAVAIGHVVGSAKKSSLQKLFNTLNTCYMENEDDTMRSGIGQALQSINNHNQELLRNYFNIIIPLIFFAMHAEKTQVNENTVALWTELWNDITPGTETGIRQNLNAITTTLSGALESASWNTKVQAANAINTVAAKLGSGVDVDARNTLLKVLTDGLRGRTWNGKEKLLSALATLASNSKETLNEDEKLKEIIIETLYRESKKEAVEYRQHALQGFCTVLHELDVDKFTEVYNIAQEILTKLSNKNTDDDGDDSIAESSKRKEDNIKLQKVVYEVLGKAWPSSKKTQDEFCIEFVHHCQQVLPNTTIFVQIAILTSLNHFVDKLVLFTIDNANMSTKDKETLNSLCDMLCNILSHCISTPKYTRIKKEGLNIVISLSKKLNETNNIENLDKIKLVVKELMPDLTKDNQPEIRTRVIDIKEMLKM